MEAFINKMRRLKGVRKMLICDKMLCLHNLFIYHRRPAGAKVKAPTTGYERSGQPTFQFYQFESPSPVDGLLPCNHIYNQV